MSIVLALTGSLGLLALALGGALAIAFLGARETVLALVQNANRAQIAFETERVTKRLDPLLVQLASLHMGMERGHIDHADQPRVVAALSDIAATHEELRGIGFVNERNRLLLVWRTPDGPTLEADDDALRRPAVATALAALPDVAPPAWRGLTWSTALQEPLLTAQARVRVDGRSVGFLFVAVGTREISRGLAESQGEGDARVFILAPNGRVLAHPRMRDPKGVVLSAGSQLPSAEEIGDPVLEAFSGRSGQQFSIGGEDGVQLDVGGRGWIVVTRPVAGYDSRSWLVGRYYPMSEIDAMLAPARNGFLLAGGALIVALALASVLGRRIAIPIRRFGQAADAVQRFDFAERALPRSRLAEIDEASTALDKMRGAMQVFGTYVPRRLVRRLVESGVSGAASKRRTVTVMFTDLVGFTSQSEALDEAATERLLNDHFALAAPAIERSGGEIDKFIGDAVMAVWGAIKRMPDHADRAVEAALEIAAAARVDNARRRADGQAPVRVRIGLHSGQVLAGNIGSPGRLNFTVIGSTVNIANRLEQLGKDYMTLDDDAVVVASSDTVEALSPELRAQLGLLPPRLHDIRGRSEPLPVYRLT